MKNNHSELEKNISYNFKDQDLLLKALTHKSCNKKFNNERLEFLGDAVLDLLVGEYLFCKFPQSSEGALSKMRSSIVNEKGFMILAQEIDLGKYLYVSLGEEQNNGRKKPSILSNAFEALMGAIYLDSNLDEVKTIIYKLLNEVYPEMDFDSLFKDYKTAVQEITQAKFFETPEYILTNEWGPDHNKEFEITLFIQGKEYAKACGVSKKVAQQKCAEIAYLKLKDSKDKK